MSSPPLCKNCGGGLPQHQEGPCWCNTCMSKPASERCTEYVPRPPKAATAKDEGFGKKPPKPPKKAPKSMSASGETGEQGDDAVPLPSPGSAQREVLDAIRGFGEKGCTDAEIAAKVEREHREIVTLRTELAEAGLLWDSGIRRRDAKGHEKVAWTALPVEAAPQANDSPLLVRDDVYVEQSGRAAILHAGQTTIRLTGVPGDLVEVRTTPSGADPDQDGGGEVALLLIIEGSEEVYDAMRNPFTTPSDVLEAMTDLTTPALNALTGIRKDI